MQEKHIANSLYLHICINVSTCMYVCMYVAIRCPRVDHACVHAQILGYGKGSSNSMLCSTVWVICVATLSMTTCYSNGVVGMNTLLT